MDIANYKIGIIGGGNMGRAIIKGLTESLSSPKITAWDADSNCRENLENDLQVTIAQDNRELASN